jgi:hypothetical protein
MAEGVSLPREAIDSAENHLSQSGVPPEKQRLQGFHLCHPRESTNLSGFLDGENFWISGPQSIVFVGACHDSLLLLFA